MGVGGLSGGDAGESAGNRIAKGDGGEDRSYGDATHAGGDQRRLPRGSDAYLEIWPNFTGKVEQRDSFLSNSLV